MFLIGISTGGSGWMSADVAAPDAPVITQPWHRLLLYDSITIGYAVVSCWRCWLSDDWCGRWRDVWGYYIARVHGCSSKVYNNAIAADTVGTEHPANATCCSSVCQCDCCIFGNVTR